jgi:hypothetical protein
MKAPNAKGVFVIGMHRSGTSALVLGLESLGLALCTDEDRLRTGVGLSNPDHGESMTMIAENEAILASFDGSWVSPRLPFRWLSDPELKKRQRVAGVQFKRSFPNEPWACKDPRISLTLPYWDAVLGKRYPAVLLMRNPLEIVESLKRREPHRRHTSSYYLCLWERYTRSALENSVSRPLFIVDYEQVLKDWPGVREKLRHWLNQVGIQTGLDNLSPINKEHRHQDAAKSLEGLSAEQKQLYQGLGKIAGAHQSFVMPDFGPETAHTRTLFGESYTAQGSGFSKRMASWLRFG